MNLELSSDQRFMRDEARRFLAERADSAAVRRAIEAGSGFDADLWRAIARELGWCAVAIREDDGGLGLGATEIAILMEETGRRLAPIPLWSTVGLAAPLIDRLGAGEGRRGLLGRIAAGECAACVAHPSPGAPDPLSALGVTAARAGSGYVLDGRVTPVLDLPVADLVLVPARLQDGGTGLFALSPANGIAVRSLESLDPTRTLGELVLDGLVVSADAQIDAAGAAPDDWIAPLRLARLALAAEQIGAASGALDMTLAYLSQRVQFGRTIASFQAIKHRCAKLLVDIAEARSLLYGAAASLSDHSPDVEWEITALGALASQVLWHAAEETIQLHGGVGNTWEYDPHLYMRRAQASAVLFGSADARLARIGDSILSGAAA